MLKNLEMNIILHVQDFQKNVCIKKMNQEFFIIKLMKKIQTENFKKLKKLLILKILKFGFTASGKLTFKHVVGGVKLVDTEFSIKENYKPFLKQ